MKKTKLSNDYPRFCEICRRWFPTGKAMGGHMRSHLAIAKLPSSARHPPPPLPPPPPPAHRGQLRSPDPANFVVPTFSPDPDQSPDESYSPTGGHSMTRRRSKRKRRHISTEIEQENTPRSDEEEVAMCLLMLSRDPKQLLDFVLKNKNQDDDVDGGALNDVGSGGKYRCETCNKGFRSYQALGGHRASHNKPSAKSLAADVDADVDGGGGGEEEGDYEDDEDDEDDEDEDYLEEEDQEVAAVNGHVSNAAVGVTGGGGGGGSGVVRTSPGRVVIGRKFPCSFCGKTFDSGQALGGHKKIHLSYHHHPAPPPPVMRTPTKAPPLLLPPGGRLMIDLNSSPLDHDNDGGYNDNDEISDEVYQF